MAIRSAAMNSLHAVRLQGVRFLVAGAIGLVAPAAVNGQVTTFQDMMAGLDYYMPAPENYPPANEAMIALGRQLFFDPMLSRDSSLACASCHIPSLAFTNAEADALLSKLREILEWRRLLRVLDAHPLHRLALNCVHFLVFQGLWNINLV